MKITRMEIKNITSLFSLKEIFLFEAKRSDK